MDEKQKTNWSLVRERLSGSLSEEEDRILRLLEAGRTQSEIGKEFGLHRSAVWRRVVKLRKALSA